MPPGMFCLTVSRARIQPAATGPAGPPTTSETGQRYNDTNDEHFGEMTFGCQHEIPLLDQSLDLTACDPGTTLSSNCA